jgi:hypothetical protein
VEENTTLQDSECVNFPSNLPSRYAVINLPVIWFNTNFNIEHDGQCAYNVTLTLILPTWKIWWAFNSATKWQMGFNWVFKELRRDGATTVAGEGNRYYVFWACVCSLWCPLRIAHVPYVHLWPAPLNNARPLINDIIFYLPSPKKKIFELIKCVFWFSLRLFYCKISHSKNNWARYDQNAYWSSCKVTFILVRF